MKQKKLVLTIFFFAIIGFCFGLPSSIYASEKDSDASAKIASLVDRNDDSLLIKQLVLKRILSQKNSPLLASTDAFIQAAVKYDIDPYLLPSISWLESSLGKHLIKKNNNPFGWGGGLIAWDSFDEGINTVASGLRYNYINKGATDVYAIGRIYATSPTWAVRVENFMNTFYNEERSVIKIRDAVTILESS